MHRGSTDRTATIVRGYAWHAYPDPAMPGVFEGDNPFVAGDAHGPGRPPTAPSSGVLELFTRARNRRLRPFGGLQALAGRPAPNAIKVKMAT
jgi:hypothetical protein